MHRYASCSNVYLCLGEKLYRVYGYDVCYPAQMYSPLGMALAQNCSVDILTKIPNIRDVEYSDSFAILDENSGEVIYSIDIFSAQWWLNTDATGQEWTDVIFSCHDLLKSRLIASDVFSDCDETKVRLLEEIMYGR